MFLSPSLFIVPNALDLVDLLVLLSNVKFFLLASKLFLNLGRRRRVEELGLVGFTT